MGAQELEWEFFALLFFIQLINAERTHVLYPRCAVGFNVECFAGACRLYRYWGRNKHIIVPNLAKSKRKRLIPIDKPRESFWQSKGC